MNLRRVQIRRYETQIRTLLDNLTLQPGEMSHWADTDLHVLVVDPLNPTHLTDYAATRDRAAGTEFRFHIYPAFRTQPLTCRTPFQFSSYLDPDFWQINAERLINVAALRLPGDLWIGLEMENFAGIRNQQDCPTANPYDGLEPTASALAHHGFTVAELRERMQPFIDALRDTNASVAVYPAGENSGEDLLYLADVLGRERLELWTETTYMNAEHYRRSSARAWPNAAAEFLKLVGQLQQRVPGCLVRPGINDLERLWSDPYRRDLLRSGPVAPWGYDETRYDSAHFGTEGYRLGTELSDLNRVQHVWPMQPMSKNVRAEFDTTVRATPTPLNIMAADERGFPHPDPNWTISVHAEGIQLVTPPGLNTWEGIRVEHVLPLNASEPFTIDGTFRLPVGTLASCPLFGMVSENIGVWQVAYDATDRRIKLYVRTGVPGAPPIIHTLDMILEPPRGQNIRVQVGRHGNVWMRQPSLNPPGGGGNRRTLPAAPPVNWDSLLIGAGQAVATFPRDRTLQGCPGIVLVGTWSIYDWLLDDAELAELRAGSWPYGYGRPL